MGVVLASYPHFLYSGHLCTLVLNALPFIAVLRNSLTYGHPSTPTPLLGITASALSPKWCPSIIKWPHTTASKPHPLVSKIIIATLLIFSLPMYISVITCMGFLTPIASILIDFSSSYEIPKTHYKGQTLIPFIEGLHYRQMLWHDKHIASYSLWFNAFPDIFTCHIRFCLG